MRKIEHEVLHQLSTEKGQSGAPILLEKNNLLQIVGIHKGGICTQLKGVQKTVNSGRLLTAELVEVLRREAERMGADPFQQ